MFRHLIRNSGFIGRNFAVGSASRTAFSRYFHAGKSLAREIKNPYETLGVPKDASAADIKKSYYKLAKQYHPDLNKSEGAEKRFHDLQNAYEILSDEKKRSQYDQFGAAAFNQEGSGEAGSSGFHAGFNGFGGFSGFNDFGGINFEDLFGAAFSGNARPGAGRSGSNFSSQFVREYTGDSIKIPYSISFKDAIFGLKNVQVKFARYDQCGTCTGSGLKKNARRTTCLTCQGTGTQMYVRGGFQMASTCTSCNGEGFSIRNSDACTACRGKGVAYNKDKSINFDIPQGVQEGDVIKISRQGSFPKISIDSESAKTISARRGDVLVQLIVKKDPRFQVKNRFDILHVTSIPITTAVLGGTTSVPTVDGDQIRLKVAPGTCFDQVVTIPNRGVPRSHDRLRGDMKVRYQIEIKKPQSKAELYLWEALADASGDDLAKRTQKTSTSTQDNDKSLKEFHTQKESSTLSKLESFISHALKSLRGNKE